MSYALTISRKHNFLHAKVTGQNSAENIKQYLEEVVKECKEAKCGRVLIEEELAGPRLDVVSVFDVASEGSVTSRGLFSAIAYVDICAEGELMDFAETVAVNRGLPIRSFRTVIEAEKWLMDRV